MRCAVRAGVPIVEDGGDLLDPFESWITRRTDGTGVVAACEAAATEAFAPVLARVRAGSGALLAGLGVDPSEVAATFAVDGDAVVVHLVGPPLPADVGRALSDRARAAVRALPRPFRCIDVGYTSARSDGIS